MEILFLGTGSCTPSPKKDSRPSRFSSGFLVKSNNETLLFDIGSGALQKMLESGIDILQNPTSLFITHFHPDHCADIIALMQGRSVAKRNGKNMPILSIYGPKGSINFFNSLFSFVEKWNNSFGQPQPEDLFEIREVEKGIVKDIGVRVSSQPVTHFDSVAYKVETEDKVLVYTGDIGYEEEFSQFGKDADMAIMECSYPDRDSLKGGTHLCPEDVGRLAKLGNFKSIALTHLYPECEEREDEMVAKIQEFTDAEAIITHDLLKLAV